VRRRGKVQDLPYQIAINLFLALILAVVTIPVWRVLILSFQAITFKGSNLQGLFIPPWEWSISAYRALLSNSKFVQAVLNSFQILFGGMATSLFLTVPLAYVLSNREIPGLKLLTVLVLIPFLFDPGLIPRYLVVVGLGLTDHLPAVFLPAAVSVYNTLVMRSFFNGIPMELKEAARIDGASEWYVLFKVMLPLSKAIILTVGLYYGVHFWNDFFSALLYLNRPELKPLPVYLRDILMGASVNDNLELNAFAESSIQSIKAASVFLTMVPMIIMYPIIQRYFSRGTLAGSIKG
jgi:putative aldouronate transport system permease protein